LQIAADRITEHENRLEFLAKSDMVKLLSDLSHFKQANMELEQSKEYRLLVIDGEPAVIALFEHLFIESGIKVDSTNAHEALEQIANRKPDTVIWNILHPNLQGLDLLERIKSLDQQLPVIVMTGGQDSQSAIKAMQLGAIDYLVKPLDVRSLNKIIRRALEIRRMMVEPVELDASNSSTPSSSLLIGFCPAMQEVYKSIGRVASQKISVLIRGESGTGKELVARAIYQNGLRRDGQFLAINCAAIPESLLESELFGHEKGSFTGADRRRIGKIEQCNGGTLFLDEIGDMPPQLQSKLLRVLQEKQFERVGGSETLTADVRILAATHRDIEAMCRRGEFREDLFYRLNGYSIELPPLRDRLGDIELLIEHFRKTANKDLGKNVVKVASDVIEILRTYSWPGNVRQLQSVIHQSILQSHGHILLADFLPPHILHHKRQPTSLHDTHQSDMESRTLAKRPIGQKENEQSESVKQLINRHCATHSATLFDDVIEDVERQLISEVLDQCNGNQTETAKRLGITRTTVRSKVNKLGIGIKNVVDSAIKENDNHRNSPVSDSMSDNDFE
jgi:DNA-binding NtrC family response regulator